ncbi:hypothetical protein FRX31_026041 [Thalictrum thalictroides]|uniref:Uncharacterized protein n=1 Tax=Thalictrum thalictroides TaxID=46969 RepID=A0A7J6VJ97_THATH|nr:hypothetical protein FRX31_026041 [Thalictrum thalictroides]
MVLTTAHVINMLTGGHFINASHARVEFISNSQRKAQTKQKLHVIQEFYSINQLNFLEGIQTETYEEAPMTFTEADFRGVYCPHNDALLITAHLGMWRVQRIFVDGGASASVIFSNCFSKMKLSEDLIVPEENPVVGFANDANQAVGRVCLPVALMNKVINVEFILIGFASAYNAILGRD